MNTRHLLFTALYLGIVYILETFLTFIPNVQFTTLLIFVYCSLFNFKMSTIFIMCYVILDNLAFGFSLFMIPMFVGWMLIPTAFKLFGHPKTLFKLTLFTTTFSFMYCWLFIPLSVVMYGVNIQVYLIADFPFEIAFWVSNMMTIMWLYEPLVKRFNQAF